MSETDQLVERLVAAAASAIRAEAEGLSYDRERVRGLTIEVEVGTKGDVRAQRVYIERRAQARRVRANDA